MNIQQLKSVLALSKKLNFTRAAEEMNIVQPAMSRQIKQLEEEIDAILFNRNKRNVQLTAAGKFFVGEVEGMLNKLDKVIKRTSQIHYGNAGEIRIGFTHSVMQSILPDILRNIKTQMPGMKTILKEMNNHDQYFALQQGKLDLGVATNPMVPKGLKSAVLHTDNFVVLLPVNHPVNESNYKDFSVFSEEEFIFPSREDGPHYVHTVESVCIGAGFTPKVVHETDSASTSFRLVEAGIGISLEPISSMRNQHFQIKAIELKEISQKAKLTMIWNPESEREHPKLFELLKGFKQKSPSM